MEAGTAAAPALEGTPPLVHVRVEGVAALALPSVDLLWCCGERTQVQLCWLPRTRHLRMHCQCSCKSAAFTATDALL